MIIVQTALQRSAFITSFQKSEHSECLPVSSCSDALPVVNCICVGKAQRPEKDPPELDQQIKLLAVMCTVGSKQGYPAKAFIADPSLQPLLY